MGRKKHEIRKAEKARKKQNKESAFEKKPLWLLLAVILTFITYSGIYENDYLNYDDDVYVTENVPLRTLDVGTLFSESYLNQYSPLAMTIMGYQFKMADADPKVIRFFSVLVHVLSVLLVFLVFRRLFRDDYSAGLLALLFGVQPMQVESVVWLAASMKIGTYALFFLLSIWFYLKYKEEAKSKWILASFAAFLASCFCKEQAVVLPLTLVAIDYLQGSSFFEKKTWLNKIPFLIVSLIFGIITLKATDGGGELAQKVYDFQLSERVIFATYSIGVYLFKSFVPIDLSFFYTYPIKGAIPAYFYAFPLLLIGILYLLVRAYKKDQRWLVFGILFFLINVALTSFTAIMSVRDVIMADRYVYIPIIGVFFILLYYLDLNKDKLNSAVKYLPLALGIVLMLISMQRVKVFKDTITLFTDVIDKGQYEDKRNPYLSLPYNNRGIAYKRVKNFDLAMKDYEEAIASNPSYPNAYLNIGNIHFDAGRDDEAMTNYTKVLSLEPDNEKALSARGAIYAKRKQYEDAIRDLTEAVSIDPYFIDAYSNRALTYMELKRFEDAIADVSRILSFNPSRDDMYEFRGYLHTLNGDYQSSVNDLTKAISINPSSGSYYYNRAIAYRGLGKKALALSDANKAKINGFQVSQEFMNSIR